MSCIRVLLVDDQTLIRDGLRALLEAQEDIQVIAEAANGRQACELAKALHPDVVLMDIRMPEMDGVEATRLIKQEVPSTVVIVLTTFEDTEYIIKAMTFGASGYLLKDIGSSRLIEAIHDGLNDRIILPGKVAAKITSRLARESSVQDVVPDDFTAREVEIIRLLILGKNNKEMAQLLYLSVGTVKNYLSQIYQKVGVSDRANAVLSLQRLGF